MLRDTDSQLEAELRQERQQAHMLQQVFGLPQAMPIEDFSCALQKTILMHGRMFISHEHVCFSSNLFGVKTSLVLPFREVVSMAKGMHGLINPSIHVRTGREEHVFASFFFRDHTYSILREVWKIQRRQLESALPPLQPGGSLERRDSAESSSSVFERPDSADSSSSVPPPVEAPADAPPPSAGSAQSPAADQSRVRQRRATPDGAAAEEVTAAPLQHEISLGEGAELACSVAEAEALLLADGSPFLEEFKMAQGASGVSVGAWQRFAGGGRVREVRLVQQVKSKLSPVRQTRVEETQRCSTLPCGRVVVQTHQVMVDAPYGDHFSLLTKWVLAAAAAAGSCSVTVSAELAWSKDTWLKKQIGAGAIDELQGSYSVFLPLMRQRLVAGTAPHPPPSPALPAALPPHAGTDGSARCSCSSPSSAATPPTHERWPRRADSGAAATCEGRVRPTPSWLLWLLLPALAAAAARYWAPDIGRMAAPEGAAEVALQQQLDALRAEIASLAAAHEELRAQVAKFVAKR